MSLEAEEEQTTSGSSKSIAKEGKMVPMDLLDEYWFFNNTLNGRRVMPKQSPSPKPPFLPKSPSPIKGKELTSEEDDALLSTPNKFATRALLRTPSLPPIRVGRDDIKEEAAAAATGSSIMFKKQLGGDRIPARPLLRAPSMPTPCGELQRSHSPSKKPTSLDIRRYCSINGSNSYYRKSFQERKWNSLSDLESMEVQGFKDLGFVFDKEGLNEKLADVIPGLRGKRANNNDDDGNDNVIRPYLSEAWFVQRSAPPILKLVDKRSGVDMKDQLKFWARAVACNVRQEC